MFFYMTQRGRKTAFLILYAFHNRTMPLSEKKIGLEIFFLDVGFGDEPNRIT